MFLHDDLAGSPPPSVQTHKKPSFKEKVVAVIPVFGRHPLLKHTIQRLLHKNGCSAVICVGEEADRSTCIEAGALFYYKDNKYLGEKWNHAFRKAKDLNPDAVLFVGSSDWLSDNWLPTMLPHLSSNYLIGKAGCYFLDIATNFPANYSNLRKKRHSPNYRLVYWPGYKFGSIPDDARRDDESIGIGRLISRKGLEYIDWKPFHNQLNASLDHSMYRNFKNNHKIIYDPNIKALSISTDLWPNKHIFESHWSNLYPSKRIEDPHGFCRQWFPEYNKIV